MPDRLQRRCPVEVLVPGAAFELRRLLFRESRHIGNNHDELPAQLGAVPFSCPTTAHTAFGGRYALDDTLLRYFRLREISKRLHGVTVTVHSFEV